MIIISQLISNDINLDLFCLVISQSVRFGGWDLIGQGLVNLSFILLDVQPPLGKMNTKTRNIHSLASNILAKVDLIFQPFKFYFFKDNYLGFRYVVL